MDRNVNVPVGDIKGAIFQIFIFINHTHNLQIMYSITI